MQPVYVSGIGMTRFGKDPRPIVEIVGKAGLEVLAGCEDKGVDSTYIDSMNPEACTGESSIACQIAEALGVTGIPALLIETASSAGAAALQAGFQAIASGYYRRVWGL